MLLRSKDEVADDTWLFTNLRNFSIRQQLWGETFTLYVSPRTVERYTTCLGTVVVSRKCVCVCVFRVDLFVDAQEVIIIPVLTYKRESTIRSSVTSIWICKYIVSAIYLND